MTKIEAKESHLSFEEIKQYRDKLATRYLILIHMGLDV